MAILSQPAPLRCSEERALAYALMLTKALPTANSVDADIAIDDLKTIFMGQAEADVKTAATCPVHGLKAFHEWLPRPTQVSEWFSKLNESHANIIRNARNILEWHRQQREIEADNAPDEVQRRKAMGVRLNDIVRRRKGMAPVSEMAGIRTLQNDVNEYALHIGMGDIAAGLEIMMARNMERPPEGWRAETGWQGEIA